MTAVKKKLARNRVVENYDYAAFIRRIVRAYSRRVAAGDVEAVPDMVCLSNDVEAAIRDAIAELRRKHGYSWADIGLRLGVTRQAAQQRWGGDAP